MKPPMTRPLLELLLLAALLQSLVSAGWSEETDWESGAWAQGQQYPGARGPEFLPGLATNVSVTLGDPAVLPCRIANLRGRSVSWIRQTDLQVLTTNFITFTTDQRFSVEGIVRGPSAVWDLRISDAVQSDQGIYQCQVNTRPKMSHPVMLHVVEGSAVIAGPSSVYLHAGSRLLLTCWVHAPPRPPPLHWGHNGSLLNDTTARGGLSLFISQEGARASTRLSLQRVDASDAGNYTCYPEGLPAASVTVYVLHEEEPAAMHHDGGHSLAYSSMPALLVFSLPLAGLQLFGSSAIYFPSVWPNNLDKSIGLPVILYILTSLLAAMNTMKRIFKLLRNSLSNKICLIGIRMYLFYYLNIIVNYVNVQHFLPRKMIQVRYFYIATKTTIGFLKNVFDSIGRICSKKLVEMSVSNVTDAFCVSMIISWQAFLNLFLMETVNMINELYSLFMRNNSLKKAIKGSVFNLLEVNKLDYRRNGRMFCKKIRSQTETRTKMTPYYFGDGSVISLCHTHLSLIRQGMPAVVGSPFRCAICLLLYEVLSST